MAIPLFFLLISGYLALGLKTRDYDKRARVILIAITFVVPAWFYFFF